MRIPILKFDKLWHLGDLDPNQKYNKGPSQEGNLFSMSRCPEAWQKIVKLGGYPLHEGDRGYTLLDLVALLEPKTRTTRQLRSHIIQWAQKEQLLTPTVVLKAYYEDGETEELMCQIFSLDDREEAEDDQFDEVVETTILTPTEKLRAIHNLRSSALQDAEDFAMIEWARQHAKDQVDGVYWDGDLDPLAYQAPRAGLFEARVESLKQIDYFPGDEDELVQCGRIRWLDISPATELSR